jgi:hypothetical protein
MNSCEFASQHINSEKVSALRKKFDHENFFLGTLQSRVILQSTEKHDKANELERKRKNEKRSQMKTWGMRGADIPNFISVPISACNMTWEGWVTNLKDRSQFLCRLRIDWKNQVHPHWEYKCYENPDVSTSYSTKSFQFDSRMSWFHIWETAWIGVNAPFVRICSEFHDWIRIFSCVFRKDPRNVHFLDFRNPNIVPNILCWTRM